MFIEPAGSYGEARGAVTQFGGGARDKSNDIN